MKKAGLVGGISWVSTMDYYKLVNEGINKKAGRLHFAECIIYSINFEDIQVNGWQNCFELLLDACHRLQKAGADVLALCANTAHLFADELAQKTGLPLIDIRTAVAEAILKKGIKKVALLGTSYTMEMKFYIEKLEQHGLQVLISKEAATREYIQHTIKEELGRGILNLSTKQRYIAICEQLIQQGAEGIILGCTEIPLLINENDFSVPVFDTVKIHSQAIVDRMLS